MSTDEKPSDQIVSRLKLDIRALTLLYESDAELQPVIQKAFLETQDDYVRRFTSLLQSKRPSRDGGSFPIAVGEIVLASFLTIVGLAAFVPVMEGLNSPQQWFDYVSGAVTPAFTSGPLYVGAPVLDFVFATALLLGAFYSLRRASRDLKKAGLVLESSGS